MTQPEDLLISKMKETTFKMILIDGRNGLKITECNARWTSAKLFTQETKAKCPGFCKSWGTQLANVICAKFPGRVVIAN